MGSVIGRMTQKSSGLENDVYVGFSWPCFFFGSLWYLVKGMWGIGLLWIVLSIFSASIFHWIGILIMPFVANRQYREHLGARGYEMMT